MACSVVLSENATLWLRVLDCLDIVQPEHGISTIGHTHTHTQGQRLDWCLLSPPYAPSRSRRKGVKTRTREVLEELDEQVMAPGEL